MAAVGWCPRRRRASAGQFPRRVLVWGFFGGCCISGIFFFLPYRLLRPAGFDVGERLGAEGISQQRDEVAPGMTPTA